MNEKLKERRKEFHLTMQDISNMMGISKGYYSLIERGERRVSSVSYTHLTLPPQA